MGYTKDAVKGISWVGAFRVTTRGVSFARTIVLARILTPAQFGIFGIATLIISFLEILTETGINVFLIQKKDRVEEYINTAWVVSIFRGIIIAFVVALLAPVISGIFNSPESTNAIYLISVVALLRGFINPSLVKFQKELRFNHEFRFKFAVFVLDSTVAILVSLITKSAIGMVWGLIAGAALEVVLSFLFLKPRPTWNYNSKQFGEIVRSGKWITGAGIFQFLFRQGDDAIVAKIMGENSLGIYQVAYKIASLPISEITDVFGRVTFPLYVKIADDKRRLQKAFMKTTTVTSVLAISIGIFLFVFGQQLILLLLGDKWIAVVPLVRILSIFGVVQAITNSMNAFLLALEKQRYVTVSSLVQVTVLIALIFPLIATRGLFGAALAPLVSSLITLPIMLYFVYISLK
jgi:O-antigen/teichoic acid export membrane protein